jgi:hypothetical protein
MQATSEEETDEERNGKLGDSVNLSLFASTYIAL